MSTTRKNSLAGMSIINLLKIDFFSTFTDEQKAALSSKKIFYALKDGDYLLHKDDNEKSFYVLMQGEIEAIDDDGNILNTQQSGSVIGEISFLCNSPRTCNVVAVGNIFVMKIDDEIMDNLDDSLKIAIKDKLIQVLVDRVTDNDQTKVQT
ncbi:MAG: cyclic nucleotide-binding domain-containing protein [Magnetococcales bacterium]|nr:cyclic nucleotide-binding domain-containing protein [Magnetococcales bacterium]